MGTTKLNIGKIPISKGEYQEGTAYQRLNQVTMLGSTYQSKIDDNTSAPARMGADGVVENINTDKWLCVAVGNVSAARKVVYNNETSGLEAGNVQEAIDETNTKVSDLSSKDYHIIIDKININGDKITLGNGIVYDTDWNRILYFNKTEISLTNDRYIVVQKSQEITEKVTPIVKTYITDGDIVLAALLAKQYIFNKELSVLYQTKNSYIINLAASNRAYSLEEAINNVPPFAQRGCVEIVFIDKKNNAVKYSLPQSSWNKNEKFWQKEDTTFSIEDNHSDGNVDFSEMQFINCEHIINENGELVIIGNEKSEARAAIPYYKNGTHVRIQFRAIPTPTNPIVYIYFGNGKEWGEQHTTEESYFIKVNDTKSHFADFVINPRLDYPLCIKLYGTTRNTVIIEKLSILPNDSMADTLYTLSNKEQRNHVVGGVDLKDMHFKLKKVHGEGWLRLSLAKVDFFKSVNDGFIVDWNTFLTNVDSSSIQHSTDKSVLNISFTKGNDLEYLLYKTNFVRNNSNQYLKLHVEQIKDGDSLAVGLVSEDKSKFLILAIKGNGYQGSIPTKITGYRLSSTPDEDIADYPNYINDIAYDSIVKEGNFDIEFAFFGTQINVNVVKEGLTYPIFKAQISTEDSDIYYDMVYKNNYHYYIGTTSFSGANASIPKVSNLDFGLSSMWCGGADTKVVRYVDGTTYMDDGCFFICSTAHGNPTLDAGGATNIFKVDAKSLEFEFVGVLNGRYQGYVDILQSTSIRYNPNDGYWYIHGTNFGRTSSKLENGYAIGYIGKTKINPLFGNVVIDMQRLDLSGVKNCFDFDFLYDSKNKYWVGVLKNGYTYKSDNPLGTWGKISDGHTTSGYEYTEGASLAIVNNKLLYTVGNRKDPNSPSIRDFFTNNEIASINKDVPCSSSESTTPSWGNIFSIYENGISRYYLICFSGRKIKDMEYGYGDVFLYEAEEISEGEEYI